ncbi:MAG: amidohydrolase family protein [Chitinophagales bacterium]|nr:amidohydrolase family protein [Chitinophagales bacterium]
MRFAHTKKHASGSHTFFIRWVNALFFFLLSFFPAISQETFPVNGITDERAETFAFINATIHTDYRNTLENSTLLIQKGKIVAIGNAVALPNDAVVFDLKGMHIYPSFIDLYSDYGVPPAKKPEGDFWKKGFETSKKGAFGWNEAIKPEISANELFKADDKAADELRKLGFGAVLTHQKDGIARGSGALVTLGSKKENEETVRGVCSAHFSFDKGSSQQDYPTSLMGAIALLRQTYLDAQWYASMNGKADYNLSLEAWNQLQALPKIFEVNDVFSLLRADKVGDEFGAQYILKGAGDEYKRLNDVKATQASLILPVNFPDAFDVANPFDALQLNLSDMKHWELAPANAALLNNAGVEFAFTTTGLKEKNVFLANIYKAIKNGLPEDAALKALTFTPAKMVNAQNELGALEKNKLANFIITTGKLFDDNTRITENWIQGKKYAIDHSNLENIDGVYKLNFSGKTYSLTIEGSPFKTKASVQLQDTVKADVQFSRVDNIVSLSFNLSADKKVNEAVRLSGLIEKEKWSGKGQLSDGAWVNWEARFNKALDQKEEKKEEKRDSIPPVGKIIYPFVAYGYSETPKQETVLIKNATVWTNEKDGILTNADILIKNGKIAAVGKNLSETNARVVDGTGKHLTSGIIDEHSHIAISRGVNEGSHASSAEVSIGDVVNSEDINIYRQLAGGVIAAQLLHGSANPIGGQSQIIKLRWGFAPEKMKLENAPRFIKFALGENVKRSNWEQPYQRYPQTRMGVEQVYIDHFTRAQEYEKKQTAFTKLSSKEKLTTVAPRRDLEMEILLQILKKERFITCHSYVQSEINMLMHVAERFGFRVNTFTHILEGYKLADKMKAHGVSASSFADWWAYKYEVLEAIPYNAAILTKAGVNTAINSDDAEMGRRLNQEAAKCIKYGGLTEEEAWKLVTLNPAKMLHIDERMGSIKVGKDADVVMWSDNPLSVYARAEMTFVDGICFYDLKKDETMRKEIATERALLIQKMLAAKKAGEKTQKPAGTMDKIWHCETMEGYDE